MSTIFFEHTPPEPGTVVEPAAVDLSPLAGRRVAVVGYGTMGRAHALNLRRSGVDVVVGSRPGSVTGKRARQEGLEVFEPAAAVAAADIVVLMVPDEAMKAVYEAEVAPNLKPDSVLAFAHGFAVAFDQVVPENGRACFLAAPKGQGDMLLAAHERGGGVPGLLAVTDDSPPETWDLAAAYAKAVGCLAGGGFVTTFRAECVSDQFGEQAILCGGVIELLKAAFDILVEKGYGPENAYFECVHELKLITDLLARHGVDGMRGKISGTAAYGGLTRGPRIVDDHVRDRMREVLAEIESGEFAKEFLREHDRTEELAVDEAQAPLAEQGRRVLPRLESARPTEGDDR